MLLVGAALLLTALTGLNFFALDRYQPTGPAVELLPPGGVVLDNPDREGIERLDLDVPLDPATPFVRIRAVAGAVGIVAGPRPWQRGRVVFVKRDREGRGRWDLPHVVALLKGERPGRTYAAVFAASPGTASLQLRLELLKAAGRLEVHSVTATPLAEAPGFRPAAAFLTGGWALLALAVTVWAGMRIRGRRWLAGFCWLVGATALTLSVLPGEATAPARDVTAGAVDLVASETATARERQAAISANMFSIAKAGHVLMFLGVGFAFGLARGRSSPFAIWLLAIGFAALCEMLQLYSPNRAPAGFDLMLNTVSASVGFVAGCFVLAFVARFRRRDIWIATRPL
ncbi:VanZ family protein [Minwuia thermotolerans]|uniref:VanZ family protein n=1 Tax=Minwuia thermotolerans TaxID=2056226 RepID=UPI0013DDF808|nr:VanZ family protein [Minwuia thermotolerans]